MNKTHKTHKTHKIHYFTMLFVVVLSLSGCVVKEGNYTFRMMQDKIDKYLIKFDVSSYNKKESIVEDELYKGWIVVGYYDGEVLKYLKATSPQKEFQHSMEYIMIDESLTYATIIKEDVLEYLILDGKVIHYDTENEELVEAVDGVEVFEGLDVFALTLSK